MSVDDDIARFEGLLTKWNKVQNLVSRETLHELHSRHVMDSLQTMRFVRETDRLVLDLGSGGGFPAIPMAIASRGMDRSFILLEPIAKKVAFLRTVARELDLRVSVHAVRAEQFDSRETFDLVTSRALAALPQLLGWAARFLSPQGHMLLHKGRNYRDELAAATAHFDFDVLVHPSESDAEGVLLEITKLRAKSAV